MPFFLHPFVFVVQEVFVCQCFLSEAGGSEERRGCSIERAGQLAKRWLNSGSRRVAVELLILAQDVFREAFCLCADV